MKDEKNLTPEEEYEKFLEETLDETDKKCPACGGTMDFDPKTWKLLCAYCGATVEIEKDLPDRAEELDFSEAENKASRDWGMEKRIIICESCGAETVYDASTVSGECPYCGSNQVMESGDESTMAPGGVCPFQIPEEDAKGRFSAWIKKKLFCPSDVKKTAKAGKMRGIYLPYWTFDTETHSTYTARYGKTRTVRRGKETKTVTDWYHTSGRYQKFINDELICATNKHDSGMLSGIEPFNTEKNVVYKPEYMAGFASERYSVGLSDAWKDAQSEIHRELERDIDTKIRREHFADRVSGLHVKTSYHDIKYKYLMLPVWMSTFKYKNKLYHFMVNGQTGKVSGKTPISPIRVAIAIFLGIVAVGLLAALLMAGEGEILYY